MKWKEAAKDVFKLVVSLVPQLTELTSWVDSFVTLLPAVSFWLAILYSRNNQMHTSNTHSPYSTCLSRVYYIRISLGSKQSINITRFSTNMNKIQLRNPSFKEIQNLSKLMKLKSIPWVDKMENRLEIMVDKKKPLQEESRRFWLSCLYYNSGGN